MFKLFFRSFLIIVFFFSLKLFAQEFETERDTVEVYLIDSFITPEIPHKFVLSFISSEESKSKVIIENIYEVVVSDEFTDSHRFELDVSGYDFENQRIPYYIFVEDSNGNVYRSEKYEVHLPYEIEIAGESNFLLLCLFGGVVFALPSPTYADFKGDGYFSLTKEIPIISLKSRSFYYPQGYFAVEYSHIFKAPVKNLLRAGYKHFIELPWIEYISPGVSGFTNFKGYSGASPEVSVGWFRIFSTFTVYTRYRFNFKPGDKGSEFNEISIGLYSGFFSIYL